MNFKTLTIAAAIVFMTGLGVVAPASAQNAPAAPAADAAAPAAPAADAAAPAAPAADAAAAPAPDAAAPAGDKAAGDPSKEQSQQKGPGQGLGKPQTDPTKTSGPESKDAKATGSKPSMARPVRQSDTTRSVVAARIDTEVGGKPRASAPRAAPNRR